MDIFTKLADKTLYYLKLDDYIEKNFNSQTFSFIEKIIKIIRNKDVNIDKDKVLELSRFALIGLYSEIAKSLIVLSIAYFFNILLPTLIIMTVFSFLRAFAGGNHMSTFNKCFVVMIYHAIFFNLPYIDNEELAEIWGQGFIKVNAIDDVNNVGAYVCRYMSSSFDDERLVGQKCYFFSRGVIRPREIYLDSEDLERVKKSLPAGARVFEGEFNNDFVGALRYEQYNLSILKR